MKMRKVFLLVVLGAAAMSFAPIITEADAAARHSRSGASVSSQNYSACLEATFNCFGMCANNAPNDELGDCVKMCGIVKTVCKAFAGLLTGDDDRAAAHGVVGQGGVKDPSAAAGKLKAVALGTQRGAATATMDGALSRPKSGAVTNSGVISASGSAVTNSGVGRRGTVAGHPVTGAAGATFRPQ